MPTERSHCLKCYKEEAFGHNSKRMGNSLLDKRVDIDKLMEDTQEDGSVPPTLY